MSAININLLIQASKRKNRLQWFYTAFWQVWKVMREKQGQIDLIISVVLKIKVNIHIASIYCLYYFHDVSVVTVCWWQRYNIFWRPFVLHFGFVCLIPHVAYWCPKKPYNHKNVSEWGKCTEKTKIINVWEILIRVWRRYIGKFFLLNVIKSSY